MASAQASNSGAGVVAAFSGQRLRDVDDRVGVERKFRQLRGQARWSSRIRLEQRRKARRAPRSSCFGVTVCVRRSPASAASDSRVSATASSIPEQPLRIRDRTRRSSRGTRCRARSDVRRDSRYPPTRRTSDPADAGRACRTSCRNGRGNARAGSSSSSVASSRSTVSCVPIQPKSCAAIDGQQVQPEIGGRRPMSEHRLRVFLEIVRRQACDLPPSRTSRRSARCGARSAAAPARRRAESGFGPGQLRRKTRPSRDGRREHPQDHERSRDQPRSVSCERDERPRPRRRARRRRPSCRRIRADRDAWSTWPAPRSPTRAAADDSRTGGTAFARSRRSSATPDARAA